MTTKLLLFSALVLIISTTLFITQTKSVSAAELKASPAVIEQVVQPGVSYTVQVTLENTDDKPRPIQIDFRNPVDESGLLLASDYAASSWLNYTERGFILSAGERRELIIEIRVPENVSSGGKYANIIIRSLALSTTPQANISSVVPEIQIPVLLTVPGAINEDMQVEVIEEAPFFIDQNSSVTSKIRVKNTGNIHNLVTPTFLISDYQGDTITYDAPPAVLIPGTATVFEVEWTSPSERGIFKESATISFGSPTNTVSTDENIFISGINLKNVLVVAMLVWIGIYLVSRRNNIQQAFKVLLKG